MPTIGPFQDHCCKPYKSPFQDHPNLPKTIIQLLFKNLKQEALHCPRQNTFVQNTHTKKQQNEWMNE